MLSFYLSALSLMWLLRHPKYLSISLGQGDTAWNWCLCKTPMHTQLITSRQLSYVCLCVCLCVCVCMLTPHMAPRNVFHTFCSKELVHSCFLDCNMTVFCMYCAILIHTCKKHHAISGILLNPNLWHQDQCNKPFESRAHTLSATRESDIRISTAILYHLYQTTPHHNQGLHSLL